MENAPLCDFMRILDLTAFDQQHRERKDHIMAHVALIGASGRAGSPILKELSDRGHKVTAIRNERMSRGLHLFDLSEVSVMP